MRIGFIGAGLMGHGMALNLLKGGHAVHVIAHRNRAPIEDLLEKGAREAESLSQIARSSDCIILCLSSSGVIEETIAALRPGLRQGQVIIDTSTSEPEFDAPPGWRIGRPGGCICRCSGDRWPRTGRGSRARCALRGKPRSIRPNLARAVLLCHHGPAHGSGGLRPRRQAHFQFSCHRHDCSCGTGFWRRA